MQSQEKGCRIRVRSHRQVQPHQMWDALRADRRPLLRPPQAVVLARESSRPLQRGLHLSESMHHSDRPYNPPLRRGVFMEPMSDLGSMTGM